MCAIDDRNVATYSPPPTVEDRLTQNQPSRDPMHTRTLQPALAQLHGPVRLVASQLPAAAGRSFQRCCRVCACLERPRACSVVSTHACRCRLPTATKALRTSAAHGAMDASTRSRPASTQESRHEGRAESACAACNGCTTAARPASSRDPNSEATGASTSSATSTHLALALSLSQPAPPLPSFCLKPRAHHSVLLAPCSPS